MIDKITAEKIKDTADIVEVVSDYVHLTRRGANFMGLCPFHNERTPSFSVNRAKNFCYCFSCHKGGSPVNFIMEKEGISYQDALRQLARKYGIKIEEHELTEAERKAQSEREAMFITNDWVMRKFQHFLLETEEGANVGLTYLYSRGITDEAIRHFKLGYAPDCNVLEALARKEGFNPGILVSLGILGKSDSGPLYDRFRGRIIYPVLNVAGKVVAFGGRDLKGAKAKYINSPESPIYHKSNELYGLHQARGEMGRTDKCYLVEGYMDVIGMWQSGLRNAIASSGTALTDAQIALIHRFTRNATLVYDGDAAGIKASMRGIDMLLAQDMDLKVLLLPEGHDPDSFAKELPPEEYRKYFEENSTDFISFKAKVLLEDKNDPIKRAQAAHSMVESLGSISDKIKRNVYIQECSRLLNIDEQILSYEANIYASKLAEQRRVKNLGKQENIDTVRSVQQNTQSDKSGVTSLPDISGAKASSEVPSTTILRNLEHNLLRLCVRYGMVPYCMEQEENDECSQQDYQMVLDYVEKELSLDGIEFSYPIYFRLMSEILSLRNTYKKAEASFSESLISGRDKKFQEGVSSLSMQELSIPELEKAEQKLQEELDLEYEKNILNFAADWLGRYLVSHEDDDLRHLASTMVAEPYVLSRYHNKTGKLLSELDRISELLPRALNELRAGVVEQEIIQLRSKLQLCKDDDECVELMQELAEKQEIRKSYAFYNGERILSSKFNFKPKTP